MQRLTVTRYTTFFFFNDTATTEIYTLSLHDALPISDGRGHRLRIAQGVLTRPGGARRARRAPGLAADRRGRRAARGADRRGARPGPGRATRADSQAGVLSEGRLRPRRTRTLSAQGVGRLRAVPSQQLL